MNKIIHAYNELVKSNDIQPDDVQRHVATALDSLNLQLSKSKDWTPSLIGRFFGGKPDPVTGLYIWGDVGRGKTMLMDLFVEHCTDKRCKRVHFHEFMRDVHQRIYDHRQDLRYQRTDEKDPIPVVARQISEKIRVLCFDEFHVNDITDAMILSRLFTALFQDGVVMVATSNIPPENLYKDGLNRQLFEPFIELLQKNTRVYELAAPLDYRSGRDLGIACYFAPNDNQAREQMNHLFTELTGEAEGKETALDLLGRKLKIPQSVGSVARFEFDDLCGQPLAANDYLKIVETYDTLFLDNIPVLAKHMRNEAKRFVMLIDALYEARTILYASAETNPSDLCDKGDVSFEFKRTISRLDEMQSQDWFENRA